MQSLAVALIVLAAAVFACWRLMPRAWRVALASRVATGARRHAHLSQASADALARKLATGACGSCDSCGTCAPTPVTPAGQKVVAIVPRPGER
ncbi:MAG: DUF6587 family protein [Burkholderiales bacterium]